MIAGVVRRKALVVAGVLLFIVATTYRYINIAILVPATSESHQATISQAIIHQLNATTGKFLLKQIGSDAKFAKTRSLKDMDQSLTTSTNTDSPLPNYFVEECDHFIDWPSAFSKPGCPKSYTFKDSTVSIVIYMKDDLDSAPVQTFLSAIQFTRKSRVTISNIVLTFINDSMSYDSHMTQIEAMKKLVTHSLSVDVTSSTSEWKAKAQGVHLAGSEQVFVVDDTLIVNRGFIRPLLFLLEDRPKMLVVPHVDSLLPARIYVPYKDKQLHPSSVVWQETSVGTYHVSSDMKMVRSKHKRINNQPPELPSGGLNGESFAGRKTWLLSILSKMKTEEAAELSLLSYMCGDGILVSKCGVVVRSNNYYITAPSTQDPKLLQKLYPLIDTNPKREILDGCDSVNHYFDEIKKFVQQI